MRTMRASPWGGGQRAEDSVGTPGGEEAPAPNMLVRSRKQVESASVKEVSALEACPGAGLPKGTPCQKRRCLLLARNRIS